MKTLKKSEVEVKNTNSNHKKFKEEDFKSKKENARIAEKVNVDFTNFIVGFESEFQTVDRTKNKVKNKQETNNEEIFEIEKNKVSLVMVLVKNSDISGVLNKNYVKRIVTNAYKQNKNPVYVILEPSNQYEIGINLLSKVLIYVKDISLSIKNEDKNKINDYNKSTEFYTQDTNNIPKYRSIFTSGYQNTSSEEFDKLMIDYFSKIFKSLEIEFSTIIISFIYLDKILHNNKNLLEINFIKRLLVGCLYLATIYNEDRKDATLKFCKKLRYEPRVIQEISETILFDFLNLKMSISDNEFDSYLDAPFTEYCINSDKIRETIQMIQNNSCNNVRD